MTAIMHQRPKIQFFHEFAESRAMHACVITCLRATRFACQRACVPAWFICQCACVPICRKRANFLFYMLINVPNAIWHANVLTWRANVPNGVVSFELEVPTYQKAYQVSKHSSHEVLKEISVLYCYIKNSTFYLIL